jgi:hypothetical protein
MEDSRRVSILFFASDNILAALSEERMLEAAQLYVDAQNVAQHVLERKNDVAVWREVLNGIEQCRGVVVRSARNLLWAARRYFGLFVVKDKINRI